MKSKKKPSKTRKIIGEEPSLQSLGKSVLLALPITVAFALLLMLPVTALLLKTGNPNAYHTGAGLAILYLATLLGGTITTRLHHRRTPLLCGLAMGGALLLLLLVISLILPGNAHTYSTALQVGLHALLLPTALLGSYLGAKERSVPRRHRK